MTLTVLDSQRDMHRILTAPLAQRPALLEQMMEPVVGMYRHFPGEVAMVAMHHQSSGFRVDRDDEHALAALDRLREADTWGRIDTALAHALQVQCATVTEVTVPDIRVILMLGDSTDTHFMEVNLGMSANGSVSGYLWINLWPTDENLARLEAVAVHELHHNLRYTTAPWFWDPTTVTLGEQVVSEGLADAFARQLYGELGYTRIGLEAQGDEAEFDKVVAALDTTGMHNFPAYVHGDATAESMGPRRWGCQLVPDMQSATAWSIATCWSRTRRPPRRCWLRPTRR